MTSDQQQFTEYTDEGMRIVDKKGRPFESNNERLESFADALLMDGFERELDMYDDHENWHYMLAKFRKSVGLTLTPIQVYMLETTH